VLTSGGGKRLNGDQLARRSTHARNFSEVTVGAQALYNLMVAERAEAELDWEVSGPLSEATRELGEWAEGMAARQGQLRRWVDDLPVFWSMLTSWGASIPRQTRGFITPMFHAAAADPHGFIENNTVRRLIVEREVDIKGRRARLESRAALIDWNRQTFGGQLSYRWPTCVSYLQDLAEAGQTGI
jgi:hypothetical protein